MGSSAQVRDIRRQSWFSPNLCLSAVLSSRADFCHSCLKKVKNSSVTLSLYGVGFSGLRMSWRNFTSRSMENSRASDKDIGVIALSPHTWCSSGSTFVGVT
eukprot:g2094.t1